MLAARLLDLENSIPILGKENFGLKVFQNTLFIVVVFNLYSNFIKHDNILKKLATWSHIIICWVCILYGNNLQYRDKDGNLPSQYQNIVTSTSIMVFMMVVLQGIMETNMRGILQMLLEQDSQFSWVLDHLDGSVMLLDKKGDTWFFKYVNKPFLHTFEKELLDMVDSDIVTVCDDVST